MIDFRVIKDYELNERINLLDAKIGYVKLEYNIDLKTYCNILRIAINSIQPETIDNLIERIEINKELERGLENTGGYTLEYIGKNNPKPELISILYYLKEQLPKQFGLFEHLSTRAKREIIIADTNDIDFIKSQIKNHRMEVVSFSELKKIKTHIKTLVFYSFNGQRDFDFIYNNESDIILILYEQEYNLYKKHLSQRKKLIEEEIKSEDRLKISGIEYEEIKDDSIDLSTSIENIVNRLDEWGGRAYEGYKNECDLLLNEIEEKILYKITTSRESLILDSNDSIFTNSGDLLKAYKIKEGDKIRIYPKEQLAENLYQVAVETEPDIFGMVEEHSAIWKQLINNLRIKLGEEKLYKKLKENGLRILAATLSTYGKGYRKFPMFNNDLRAIFKLHYFDKSDFEIDTIIKPILKSKTTYNSTMIVLGRGLKQELRLFLKENQIGEILAKRNFNAITLKTFIDEYMPVHTVINKEAYNDEIENLEIESLFQQLEL